MNWFLCVTWLIPICGMPYSFCTWRDSRVCMCGMTHGSYVWWDSFLRVTWLNSMRDMAWQDDLQCVTWLIHVRDMHAWGALCARVTKSIHTCDMTSSSLSGANDSGPAKYSYVWHDSFICVTWLIRMCDMTHSYTWAWLIHMCDIPCSYVWHDSYLCVT